jgi:hypothetical protein
MLFKIIYFERVAESGISSLFNLQYHCLPEMAMYNMDILSVFMFVDMTADFSRVGSQSLASYNLNLSHM